MGVRRGSSNFYFHKTESQDVSQNRYKEGRKQPRSIVLSIAKPLVSKKWDEKYRIFEARHENISFQGGSECEITPKSYPSLKKATEYLIKVTPEHNTHRSVAYFLANTEKLIVHYKKFGKS